MSPLATFKATTNRIHTLLRKVQDEIEVHEIKARMAGMTLADTADLANFEVALRDAYLTLRDEVRSLHS